MQIEKSLRIVLLMILATFILVPWSAFSQTCPEGCQCISESKAKEMFGEGNYELCQKTPCGEEQSASGRIVPKYCIKPRCPQGCSCLTQEEAKRLGYQPCSDRMISCGSDPNGIPKYCFSAETDCPIGCRCLTESEAKELSYSELCQNQRITCGLDAYGNPKFCFKVPTSACPVGCICLGKEEALAKGLKDMCLDQAGNAIICEVIDAEKGIFRYCFKQPDQSRCIYDYDQGKCIGSCPEGGRCQINTIKRDPKTGKVIFAECHCK